jgi:hypothetical protein
LERTQSIRQSVSGVTKSADRTSLGISKNPKD